MLRSLPVRVTLATLALCALCALLSACGPSLADTQAAADSATLGQALALCASAQAYDGQGGTVSGSVLAECWQLRQERGRLLSALLSGLGGPQAEPYRHGVLSTAFRVIDAADADLAARASF